MWLEIWWQGSLGKRNVDKPLWIDKKMWSYLCPMWMLTKGWLQQRRIITIKWIGWPIRWISVSLFPSHPHHHWMGSWTNWPWWSDGGYPGLSNVDFSPKLMWLQPLLTAQSTSSRHRYWVPDTTALPRVISQLPRGRGITSDFPITEETAFYSYQNIHLLWIWICLPCMQNFCWNNHPPTYECLTYLFYLQNTNMVFHAVLLTTWQ